MANPLPFRAIGESLMGEALRGATPISKLMLEQTGDSYAAAIVTRDETGLKLGLNRRD